MLRIRGERKRSDGGAARIVAITMVVMIIVSGCGDDADQGGQISWLPGTPPREATETVVRATATIAATEPAVSPTQTVSNETITPSISVPESDETPSVEAVTGPLTDAQRVDDAPNELGVIPVLMYHDIVDAPTTSAAYTRTLEDFKAELQRLYDDDYHIVPLRDVILNRIAIPAGKHPVVLTFDDGIANQFRYLIGSDGGVTIDPTSAVGVLEAFSAEHPDFGRGGFFAVPPDWCFDWTAEAAEPDQTPYCAQKLRWLIDNGYEVGNHTLGHSDLLDIDDKTFQEKVGQGWTGLQDQVPEVQPDILAMPFGNYPDLKKHRSQREMMREGFEYNGVTIKLLGALQVGAEPAVSPVSTEWDPLFIARIQGYDGDYGSDEWLSVLEDDPARLYTSDGDPDTISVPSQLPPSLDGTLDPDKAQASGSEVIIYDPETGEVT